MWCVFHNSQPSKTGFLNRILAFTTTEFSNAFNSTAPTSQVFTVGHPQNNNSGDTCRDGNSYVAYCFTSIEGFSAFGSYVSNGVADGPFIYTGHKPALLWIKNIDSTSTNWMIWDNVRDTYNVADSILRANLSDEEDDGTWEVDFLSNGFKIREANSDHINNTNSDTYIYCSWAEMPFKYSATNAR